MGLLQLRGIRKSYPGVRALAGVDLEVDAGEVHALLGENGAGKSTLMKVIAGAVLPDDGSMTLDGRVVPLGAPVASRAAGIGIVFQELSLVPPMSVGENVLLGRWAIGRLGDVDLARTLDATEPWLERVGLGVSPAVRVDTLGMAERQLVEIAKALSSEVRVLLLDEPTSALSDREARRLFALLGDLKRGGVAIIYVSHRLPEVIEISDRITVLRDGLRVDTIPTSSVDEKGLAQMMVGASLSLLEGRDSRPSPQSRDAVLVARGLGRPPRLRDIDLTLHAGEIVTGFGLVGAGRTRLARTLFGLEPATTGTLEVFGEQVLPRKPAEAIGFGIGYVGEDRAAGLAMRMSVAANITLASLNKLGAGPVLDRGVQAALADLYIRELNIKTSSGDQLAGTLSGGNQQKTLLARAICSGARILILDDPVRGVDVGAKEEVYRLVRSLADSGVAVLYLTSELREARNLGDRIIVMAKGGIAAELPADASENEIMALAGGIRV